MASLPCFSCRAFNHRTIANPRRLKRRPTHATCQRTNLQSSRRGFLRAQERPSNSKEIPKWQGRRHPPAGQRAKMEHLPYSPRHLALKARQGNCRRGEPMINRFRDFARALLTVVVLGVTGAAAQTSQTLTSPPGAAPQAPPLPAVKLVLCRRVRPVPRSTKPKSRHVRTRTWASTSRRQSPVGSASLIGWKAIYAARGCVMRN